jgi:xylulose-5-phosphate/fructose-6-phosphate phosphoketolase
VAGAHVKEALKNRQIACRFYAHENGVDPADTVDWTWKR